MIWLSIEMAEFSFIFGSYSMQKISSLILGIINERFN